MFLVGLIKQFQDITLDSGNIWETYFLTLFTQLTYVNGCRSLFRGPLDVYEVYVPLSYCCIVERKVQTTLLHRAL